MHEIVLNGYTAQHSSNRCLHLGTAESYGIEKLHITPGPGWDGMLIKATFHPTAGSPVNVLVGESGVIDVPPEATAASASEYNPGVIVFSGVMDGVQRISANLAYTVMAHAAVDGVESEPTPSQWEQLASAYQSKVDKQQGAENAGKVLSVGEDGLVMPVDGKEIFWVNCDTNKHVANHTSIEIMSAVANGYLVLAREDSIYYRFIGGTDEGVTFQHDATSLETEASGKKYYKPVITRLYINETGSVTKLVYKNTEATMLPNPYPLTFSGAVNGTYDGSSEFNVEIPEAPEIPERLPNPSPLTFSGAVSGSYDGSKPLNIEIPEGGTSGTSAPSDWAVNDPDAPGYIKNRTHWAEDPVRVTVLPEQTVTIGDEGNALLPYEAPLIVGDEYTLTIDGVSYTETAFDMDGLAALGNMGFAGLEDTGEPYLVGYVETENIMFFLMDTPGDHTLSIIGEHIEYHTIDRQYLPYLIGREGTGRNAELFNTEQNRAGGDFAHAEGMYTIANGDASHTEGAQSDASGQYAHAEGCGTIASGTSAHAEGYECTAFGMCSHAEGQGTYAGSTFQHVQGRWNTIDMNGAYAHVIGAGLDGSNRRNIHTVKWNGDAWYKGTVYVGGSNYLHGSDAKEVATKDDFDTCVDETELAAMLEEVLV